MKFIPVLVALFFCCHPGYAFQITEFCPDPYLPEDPDEYLVLSGYGKLDGIIISDGEGGFRFPTGTSSNGSLIIARQGISYHQTHGIFPDYEWSDTTSAVPDVISGNILRMANSGDELMLYDNISLLQIVSWPADVKPREGQVHYLKDGVWDRRPFFIGQSEFSPETFHNVTVTTFVSPDSANDVFTKVVDSAKDNIHINVYEFSSPVLAGDLIQAKERGTDIIILVEGGPVGGMISEEKAVLWNLNQTGIPVYQMTSLPSRRAPYRFDHAKYMVIDERLVLLTSENFKGSGVPPAGYKGNRGWGVVLEDPALADYFERIFTSDIGQKNSVPITGIPGPYELSSTTPYSPDFSPQQYYNATVIPVVSPDTSYLLFDLINGARESIEIEQAYITNESTTNLNPYLAAAINASRHGVHVRVLLDSYWYNTEEENDNDEMIALINRIAAAENLPLEAKCADLTLNNLEKIHNKGVIVDSRSVLVSSINWNSNSPNFNRETGVIIHHRGVAEYFRTVFEDDWNPGISHENRDKDNLKLTVLLVVLILLLIIYWKRRSSG